ncbi:MFS transporter [Xanthomonas arboricola]|uniref:MFS transporter n=4 Tax=Xanthomonas arboricola pv. pruni TaxID=69929 RepID=A0AAP4NJ01_9XANT|nr:MFS transporter [Xanthomonas arboricola]GAE49454.1 MFS transporter [Xanthomonas arboricola pv. pruni str. MAFF 311562]GAE55298.1 MFS transporter [Xanthomonas arboricola pv. pruni MAFF 301420]GAE61953.1 MFS transporter [Xanthomonas arboricola pv. pruni MAFF 301427]KCW99161.1 major facilitator transporter [Xanthomonas arboricola pv. pruni]KPN11009.1 MFS transporter [Xanthomonas arboricola pv. pruni]
MRMSTPRPRGSRALEALHFSVADVQDGLGPFLSVFLQSRGWSVAAIGTVMSVGGIAGMLATTPAGALVDSTRRKRAVVVVGCLAILLATALIWLHPTSSGVVTAQIVSALAAAGIGPALTGITLGLVHARGFDHQLARNQVANHAGNMLAAVLAGWLGWRYGFAAVFVLTAAFGVLAIAAVLLIPSAAIDHRAARGLGHADGVDTLSGWRVLLTCRPLALLAITLGLFHLGNAAMLPLYGMAIVAAHAGDANALTATTIVVAQATMVGVALLAMRWIRVHGHWWVLLVAFMALPLRALVAASLIHGWGVFPVQILDGLGAGLQAVVVPALVARLLQGTGRVNVGQGAVMTVQGVGAALSPALGGWLAHAFGYRFAFLALGGIALLAVALWAGCRGMLQAATDAQAMQ